MIRHFSLPLLALLLNLAVPAKPAPVALPELELPGQELPQVAEAVAQAELSRSSDGDRPRVPGGTDGRGESPSRPTGTGRPAPLPIGPQSGHLLPGCFGSLPPPSCG